MNKRLSIYAILALTAVSILLFLPSEANKQFSKQTIDATPVEIAVVQKKPLQKSTLFYGNCKAGQSIEITSHVTEHITSIDFVDGQWAEKGTILAKLSQDEEQAALQAAKARHKEQSKQLQRLEKLLEKNATAIREYEKGQADYEALQHEITVLQARISDRTLRAPFSGKLGLSQASVGALLSPGEVLTTLDDLSAIQIDFSVPSRYLTYLKPNLPVTVKHATWGDTFLSGNLSQIDTRVDDISRSIVARAILDNSQGLLFPGMIVAVELLFEEREALLIPEEAVFSRKTNKFVWRINKNTSLAEQVQVVTGQREAGLIEVTSGVFSDDWIVIRGIQKLHPGKVVRVAKVHYPDRLKS